MKRTPVTVYYQQTIHFTYFVELDAHQNDKLTKLTSTAFCESSHVLTGHISSSSARVTLLLDAISSQSGRQSENDGRGSSQPITPLTPLALPKIGAGLGLGSLGFGFSYLKFSDSASFTLTSSPAVIASPADEATGEATADRTAVISSNGYYHRKTL
ncbi:hypothetical protein BDP27DRAFT_1369126 [Rhodocollybia butyracea]|uniref:Uncharacterized protein n=1 Tax=Rhodocollybia butyracea TaxID=206335 RepID=A0A9P5U003_9AGAR|nr:hypothetical protein BDP27DRAFT_1369126 [Rhodocollybia butyracea]